MTDNPPTVPVDPDAMLTPGRDEPWQYPIEVEVEHHEFDAAPDGSLDEQPVLSFAVPETLPKARSAYCHDPLFNQAVNVYADRKELTPERALRESTGQLLSVEERLLGPPEFDGEDVVTLRSLKQAYVEGRLTIEEFERRLAEQLDDRGEQV